MRISSRCVALPLSLTALLMIPSTAKAQTSGVGVGVKAGMNSSTLAGPLITKATQLTGVTGGLFVSGAIGQMAGFQVEALLSQKGAKEVDGRDQSKVRITYLDVPLLLCIGSMGNKNSAGAHVFLGPTIGLKLNSSATYNGAALTEWKDSELSGLDLGLTFGAGATFGQFGLDARYTVGMRSVDSGTNPDDVKNRAFSLMLGYRFK